MDMMIRSPDQSPAAFNLFPSEHLFSSSFLSSFFLHPPAGTMSPSRVHARDGVPLPYTASPLRLFWSDVFLFLRYIKYFPDVVLPLTPWNSGALDELYPSGKNLFDIAVHSVLLVFQTVFLLSLPLCVVFLIPAFWIMLYALAVLLVNCTICRFALNGSKRFLVSKVPVSEDHRQEHWIFINGIAVGYVVLGNQLV